MKRKDASRILLLAEATPDDRKSLAVIRSLARAGYRLTIASDSFRGRPFHSRFARQRILIPHPAREPAQFLTAVRDLLQQGEYATVLPTTDYMTYALSQSLKKLPAAQRLPVPGSEATAICKDKLRTAEFALKLGLAVPHTCCPPDLESLNRTSEALSYPCILKPRSSAGSIGMTIASTREELLNAYDALPDLADAVFNFRRPLVQEFINGSVHEVCALFNHGQPRAVLSQRRLLMYPASGGAGIYNETTDEPNLKKLAIELLRALEWHGPAQVEFIRDSGTGRACLLEVNGRFWGTLDLAIAAGMDFPVMACRMAIEGDVKAQYAYRVGLRFRWPFPYAILHAMETGRWLRDGLDFLLPRRATRSDLILSDPMPLIMEFIYTLQRFRKNRFKTIRSTQDWSGIVAGDEGRESTEL